MPNHELQPGLVSIISPCYNVERFIGRFFDSLVAQTYKRLEVILVNDGSTDGTGELIRASVPRLEAEGYLVKVVEQENRGLAGAIDAGLKHFTGEFLTWPDPDDWLTPDSIEDRVSLLRRYPQAGLVRSAAQCYIEAQGAFEGYTLEPDGSVTLSNDLFDALFFHRTWFYPICHFARSSMFLETTGRSIFVSKKASQNIQMLIPLVQSHPSVIAKQIFGYYAIRADSRSRDARSPAKLLDRLKMMHENTAHMIERLQGDQSAFRYLADQFFFRNRFLPAAFEGGLRVEAEAILIHCELGKLRKAAAQAMFLLRAILPEKMVSLTMPGETPDPLSRLFRKIVYFQAPNLQS